ncbi:MAG: coproporphyrinogen dehydrogenase HemZ [Christensenellales bacterium]
MTNISINFTTDREEFLNDFMELLRAYYPYVVIERDGDKVSLSIEQLGSNTYQCIIKDYQNPLYCSKNTINLEQNADYVRQKSEIKRHAKIALYQYLQAKTGVSLPYGSLTGIRPTKLFHDLTAQGIDAEKYFTDTLSVSPAKADLISSICHNQRRVYCTDTDMADLFINIPICVSRCVYCSFLSAELSKISKSVEPYCDLLHRDVADAVDMLSKAGKKIRSIYVGGGTPTSLTAEQLQRVLSPLDKVEFREFTVEAGRPDTIDRTKLQVFKDFGVGRISVNPQTFNQKTLDEIGRKHTVDDIYKIYEIAKNMGFDVNMDLIAMLPNEDFEDFRRSVDSAVALDPDNITVHTLAIKRGSALKLDGYDNKTDADLAENMVNYSIETLIGHGYMPYYMYKQKYMSGNLENIGYCKAGKECIYNIDIMEETHDVVACGAGGISKAVYLDQKRLERLANPKGLDVYLERGEDNMLKRREFFEEKFNS